MTAVHRSCANAAAELCIVQWRSRWMRCGRSHFKFIKLFPHSEKWNNVKQRSRDLLFESEGFGKDDSRFVKQAVKTSLKLALEEEAKASRRARQDLIQENELLRRESRGRWQEGKCVISIVRFTEIMSWHSSDFALMAGCSCDRPDSDSKLWRLKTRQVSDLPEVKAVMAIWSRFSCSLLLVKCGMSSFGMGRNRRPAGFPRCSPMHSVAWERHWRLCCNAPKSWECQSHLGVKEVSAAVQDWRWQVSCCLRSILHIMYYIYIYIVCIVCIWWKLKCRWFYATFL